MILISSYFKAGLSFDPDFFRSVREFRTYAATFIYFIAHIEYRKIRSDLSEVVNGIGASD
jgi:hypothetical protein